MRTPLASALGLAATTLAGALACGGGAVPPGLDRPLDEGVLAAYQCMPPAVQRTYVDLERRRVGLTRELVRSRARAGGEEAAAWARRDPRIRTLTGAQASMLREYTPSTPHGSCDAP